MSQLFDRPITVKIHRARQIDDLDPGLFQGGADFFPEVSINNREFTRPRIDNRDDVSPADWEFVNSNGLGELVLIRINLAEFDSNNSNDIADINPTIGRKDLLLTYDLRTGQIFDTNTQQLLGVRDQIIPIEGGAGDGSRAAIEFSISGGISGISSHDNAQILTGGDSGFFGGNTFDTVSPGEGATGMAVGDFDRNGVDDLAVTTFQGAQVFTGGSNGLSVSGQGITSSGNSLAVGDINGDQVDDLIVGQPIEAVNGKINAGSIEIFYGADGVGLNTNNKQLVHQDSNSGFASAPENDERFGTSLAVADFNRDGFGDVVIGNPFNKESPTLAPGAVQIIYGSSTGLNETRRTDQQFGENVPGIPGGGENGDEYGRSVAVGDFNNDGHVDLAVGIPGNRDDKTRAGSVQIISGSPNGLTLDKEVEVLSQVLDGFEEVGGARFGKTLAVGDFNGDTIDDLAVGAPGMRLGTRDGAGQVFIYYGRNSQNQANVRDMFQLRSARQPNPDIDVFNESSMGGNSETNDRFGSSLAAKDLNGDGVDELVIGASGENNGAGFTHLLFGVRNQGLSSANRQLLAQGGVGVPGVGEGSDGVFSLDSPFPGADKFGHSLAIGNFNGDRDGAGRDINELVVSAPGEDFNDAVGAGVAHVVSSNTIRSLRNASTQTIPEVLGNSRSQILEGGNQDGILNGRGGNDQLDAAGGGDLVIGGQGSDLVNAGTGDDLLDGGKDRDTYIGGEGYDIFVLASQSSDRDVIRDFEDKIDAIGLTKGLQYADLTFKRQGRNTKILDDQELLATVRGVRPNQLTAKDFVEIEHNRVEGILLPSVVV